MINSNKYNYNLVSPQEIKNFKKDGAIVLRNVFDTSWVKILKQGIERDIKNPSPRFKSHTVKKDVPKYLNCADIGFMLRDSRDLNKAASPVKFPEYLACNLKVVASPGIGDVSDCIIKNDCGILIDTLSVDDGIKNLQNLVFKLLKDKNNKTTNKIPLRNYLWQNYSEIYKEIYN